MYFPYKKIIVKIGSNVLTQRDGFINEARLQNITAQLVALKQQGIEVILVSSGAVASGRSIITVSEKADTIAARQVLAAVGQVQLINTYTRLLQAHSVVCAQVLVTKEDFRDRRHYLNMKACFEALLQQGVIPIVNENDVVSVTELMFTDNDELAGLVAAMLNAGALIILSNVDGVYNGNPKEEGVTVIREIGTGETNLEAFVVAGKSAFGRGGMITKSVMAQKVARLGIPVHIANGTKDNILLQLLQDNIVHTRFVPAKTTSGTKKWLANAASSATGEVRVNAGAATALLSGKAASLLPVGLLTIQTDFSKGDVIRIADEGGRLIGLGIAQYGADKARERLGQRAQKPLVHYDYFYPVQ